MLEKIIKYLQLKLDASEVEKGIDSVNESTEELNDNITKVNQSLDETGKTAKKQGVAVKGLQTAVRGVGTALKALGIGLIIAAVAALTEAFTRNKKVMDLISVVVGTVQEVFSQIVDAIVNTYEAVAKSSENFDALGKVIGGLLTIAITPLKLAFFGIKLGIQEAQLIWENSFFGDGDPQTIKELTEGILETKQTITDIGNEAVKAGKQVVDNFSEAVDEVGNIATTAVDEFSKVSVKTAYETAKNYKAATDAAVIAQAQAGKLAAQYERQAEKLRQLRDDDTKSIADRKKANEDLLGVLNKQEEQLLKQADAVIAGARAELAKNDSVENRAALIDAEAAKQQVLADIEGKRSEQEANRVALLREERDLQTSISDAELQRQINKAKFDAEQEEDPLTKLEKQKKALDLENQLILEDLERKRELYDKGTQDRVDAEQEYLDRKQEIDNEITANEKEQAKAREKISDEEKEGKLKNLETISGAISGFTKLAGENTAVGKVLGVAQATIDTYIGANKALAQGGIWGAVAAAGVIASGLANVSSILSVQVPEAGGNTSTIPGGRPQGAAQPNFNIVGQSTQNQLANTINNQQNQPIQAYVVSEEVTTAQSLDRNRINNATFI